MIHLEKIFQIYTFENKCLETSVPEYNEQVHKIFFNTTADLSNLPQNMRNMLEYINTGATNDVATKSLDEEVKEARLKEEWKAEYMLTLVHDKDVYRDGFDEGYDTGYDARQAEIDEKDATINQLLKELEEYKTLNNK